MRWRKEYGRSDQGEGDQGEEDGAYDKSSFEIKGTGIRVTYFGSYRKGGGNGE